MSWSEVLCSRHSRWSPRDCQPHGYSRKVLSNLREIHGLYNAERGPQYPVNESNPRHGGHLRTAAKLCKESICTLSSQGLTHLHTYFILQYLMLENIFLFFTGFIALSRTSVEFFSFKSPLGVSPFLEHLLTKHNSLWCTAAFPFLPSSSSFKGSLSAIR